MVEPRLRRRLVAAAALLGPLLAQPGHALGYLAEYGGRSFALQSQGAHAYFPATLQFTAELLVTMALVVALVLALGRLALGRALGLRRGPCVPARGLVLVLVTVQLNVFLFQELVEAAVIGVPADANWLLSTLVAAIAGQLPVAIVTAFLLSWCAVPLRRAVAALKALPAATVLAPEPLIAWTSPGRAEAPSAVPAILAAHPKRGPPLATPIA